jgi:hypothetical protein
MVSKLCCNYRQRKSGHILQVPFRNKWWFIYVPVFLVCVANVKGRYLHVPDRHCRQCNEAILRICSLFIYLFIIYLFILHDEGPRSRCYGRTTALRLFVQP